MIDFRNVGKSLGLFVWANIVALSAFWVATSHLPDKLVVVARTAGQTGFRVEGAGTLYFYTNGWQQVEALLPGDRSASLALQIPGGTHPEIDSVWLRRRKVFQWTWTGPELSRLAASGRVPLERSSSRFSLMRSALVLLVGWEALLLLMVWLRFWKGNRGTRGFNRSVSLRDAAVAALPLAWLVAVVVPTRIWLSNADAFVLSPPDFARDVLLLFLQVWGVGFLAGYGALRFGWRWPTVALVAGAVYVYLATGPLAADIPALTGDMGFFENRWRSIADLLVAAGALIAVSLGYWLCRRKLGLGVGFLSVLALAVVVMASASVIDALGKPDGHIFETCLPQAAKKKVLASFAHSPRKNVAVYVLDSISTPHVQEVLARSSEIRAALAGFTCFTNNLGMHYPTYPSIAGIMTGRHYEDPAKYLEYGKGTVMTGTFVDDYVRQGADIFLMPGSVGFGLLSRRGVTEDGGGVEARGLYWRLPEALQWNVYEVARLQIVPFCMKLRTYVDTTAGWQRTLSLAHERTCYPLIARAPVDGDCGLTLQFWHTDGTHPPLDVDRRGGTFGMPRTDYQAKVEKTWYALSALADLLDALRQRGLYDKTFLVVTADHGSYPSSEREETTDISAVDEFNDKSGVPIRAQPFLWIKPLGASGPLSFSSAPTTHANLCRLLSEAATNDVDACRAAQLLSAGERLYRRHDGNRLLDFVVDEQNRVTRRERFCRDVMSLPVIALKRRFAVSLNADFPVLMTSVRLSSDNRTVMTQHGFMLQFRAARENRRYLVRLRLTMEYPRLPPNKQGFGAIFKDETSGNTVGLPASERAAPRLMEIEAMSDDRGVVTLSAQCGPIALHELTVLPQESQP